ncbi:DNA-binding transcriptional MocR family regulator [Psychromicrobium silvestre]|uniref:DNA-binding transcriptional MocR family regulator n=1 Tax=Psychromicrobium silvestre TaxID=1645614 RepID=A0A7Y9S491_9MICC|nr:PLP-dependent aminotransferase family protein [Psychromicrobium silvestre]NYE94279.1 DNA-binding transcriptional MocR family regulator [Psychromicrobium silvestre]
MTQIVSARRLARELGEWRSHRAAYLALADRVRVMLIDGRLASGSRLPAERELSSALQVSRTTVAAAYAQLREDSYLHSVRGSGSTLSLPDGHRGAIPLPQEVPLDFTKAAAAAYPGLPAAYQFAVEQLPNYLSHQGFDMQGLPELRAAVADHYIERGLPTTPDQVLITLGAQHALSLLTHTIYSPGERILIEHPTYPHAIDTFLAAGARLLAMPVSSEGGWDVAEGQMLIRRAAPSMGFLMPDFQNPTGASMSADDRERLARLAAREGTTLVVDETTASLDIDRGSMPPMASFSGSIVTVGSLGKLAWGGLRIGWIRGSRDLLARVLRTRPAMDLGTPLLEQLASIHLLGETDLMAANRSRGLRAGRDLLAAELARHFPQWPVHLPDGGMSLWINTGETSSSALALAARAEGLALVPGPRFGLEGAFERFLRLPFTYRDDELRAGVQALVRASRSVGSVPGRMPLQAVI